MYVRKKKKKSLSRQKGIYSPKLQTGWWGGLKKKRKRIKMMQTRSIRPIRMNRAPKDVKMLLEAANPANAGRAIYYK
jgi:hypothetical protein